jgi:hypothetical protein
VEKLWPVWHRKFRNLGWVHVTARPLGTGGTPPALGTEAFLYVLEAGRLRAVGWGTVQKAGRRPSDALEWKAETFGVGDRWDSVTLEKGAVAELQGLLGRLYLSPSLKGPDLAGLPGGLQRRLRERRPWVGMSDRVLRACFVPSSGAIDAWRTPLRRTGRVAFTVDGRRVALEQGRVTATGSEAK